MGHTYTLFIIENFLQLLGTLVFNKCSSKTWVRGAFVGNYFSQELGVLESINSSRTAVEVGLTRVNYSVQAFEQK